VRCRPSFVSIKRVGKTPNLHLPPHASKVRDPNLSDFFAFLAPRVGLADWRGPRRGRAGVGGAAGGGPYRDVWKTGGRLVSDFIQAEETQGMGRRGRGHGDRGFSVAFIGTTLYVRVPRPTIGTGRKIACTSRGRGGGRGTTAVGLDRISSNALPRSSHGAFTNSA